MFFNILCQIIITWMCLNFKVLYTSPASLKDKDYWYQKAKEEIEKRTRFVPLQNNYRDIQKAKNVIYFVGDGMSIATITAARIYGGQRAGKSGEEHNLAWEAFPAISLAKTFNADAQTGESSACATALMCGVKANYETVGLDANGKFENCLSSFKSRTSSILEWAQQLGKSTGIVTNTRITHATPAALYGHSPSRYWEDDSKVPPSSRKSCKDLAKQLIENDPGRNINVLLGGGRRHWISKATKDPELTNEEGRRLDGRNLIEDWLRDKKRRKIRAEYVWNRDQLSKINPKQIDQLLGLFAYSHMDFEVDRDTSLKGDPSLAEMTRIALKMLKKNSKGFFLFVEGGRIDHAHHYNNPHRALDETLALESAVLTALELVDLTETLIIVTSDHSHVLTMGGQATPLGNPILGVDNRVSDVDGQPYSVLLYGNGPGYISPRSAPINVTKEAYSQTDNRNSVHSAAIPRQWATHGGEDVPVYAIGPMSNYYFSGVVDQSYIPHAIAYIACYGSFVQRCKPVAFNRTVIDKLPLLSSTNSCQTTGTGGGSSGISSTTSSSTNRNSLNNHLPVIIASSVMADDGRKVISSSNNSFLFKSHVFLSLVLWFWLQQIS